MAREQTTFEIIQGMKQPYLTASSTVKRMKRYKHGWLDLDGKLHFCGRTCHRECANEICEILNIDKKEYIVNSELVLERLGWVKVSLSEDWLALWDFDVETCPNDKQLEMLLILFSVHKINLIKDSSYF